MRNLKIDPELRDLLPPLSKEKFKQLEKMILKEGYDGTPILIWNGYIVDGHHRYSIFKKHNIEFNTEVISIPNDADKSEIMEWMITYQDVRRNMCDAEKIYANDKVSARRIAEENEKKRLKGNKLGADITNGKAVSVQMDGERKSHTSPTHTREQRAKLSGVSTGTVARYDTVMNSDNNQLKQSMLAGDVKIGTAYKKVVEESKKENKEKEQTQQPFSPSCDEQTRKICEFMKTERKGDFNYDIKLEIDGIKYVSNDAVEMIDSAIFKNAELIKYITSEDCNKLIFILQETKNQINELIKKMEELKHEKKNNE